ncbi:hypothetical protein, partial [Azospirillum sp. ST 5-10]|uniref:hypothetical protein n=1 Tax=Azospirillum sp. ST 5-10 TaxID=3445776 RepID=UPI003F4A5BCC
MTTVDGQRGVQLTLDHYGSNDYNYRTEIQPNALSSSHFSSGMFAEMGGEFWYSLDTYMPESWSQTDKSDT